MWEEEESSLQRAARLAQPTRGLVARGEEEEEDPAISVRVILGLTGEVLLHRARCRCRHDLVTVLAAKLDDVWPGEIRLVLPGNNVWTDPPLPAELVQLAADKKLCTVQFVRVRETRSIVPPPFFGQAILYQLNFDNDMWCCDNDMWSRDLGQPTAVAFETLRRSLADVGYKGVARALLLRRRLDELLPMYDYSAEAAVEAVLADDALWDHLRYNVTRGTAKAFLKALGRKGVIDLGDEEWRFRHK